MRGFASAKRRQFIHTIHPPTWLVKDAPRDRSNRLLGDA
jgi:hypothetical protein